MKMKRLLITILLLALAMTGTLSPLAEGADRKDSDSRLITAIGYINSGDYDNAAAELEAIIAVDPEYDAAHYYLGICRSIKGQHELGKDSFRKASALDTANYWYQDYLARTCWATGELDEASQIYERLIRNFPDKTDIYFTLVNLYSAQGQADKVMATLDEIEHVSGNSEMLAIARYQTLMSQKKYEEAFSVLELYNDQYTSERVLSTMGDYKLSQYEDSLAIVYYNEALSYSPAYGPAMIGKVEAYRIGRHYPEFFAALDEYVTEPEVPQEASADYLSQMLKLSDPRFLKNFREELDSVVTHFVAREPSDSTTLTTAGAYWYNTERKPEGIALLKRSAELYPDNLGIRGGYIWALAQNDEWDKVVVETEKAYNAFPEETSLLSMKATAYFNLSDYHSFIAESERIIEADPGDTTAVVRAYSGIGDAWHMLGDGAKAYKAYDKALKYDPKYVPVLNNYAYYLSEEKRKLKKAYAMSRITVEAEPDNPTYLDTFGWILHLQGRSMEAKPFFKHAMLYGGKDNVVILDHYAEVLYALKEYDLAKVYWNMAKNKNTNNTVPDLEERSSRKLAAVNK